MDLLQPRMLAVSGLSHNATHCLELSIHGVITLLRVLRCMGRSMVITAHWRDTDKRHAITVNIIILRLAGIELSHYKVYLGRTYI